jgi:dihydropteroate synthase
MLEVIAHYNTLYYHAWGTPQTMQSLTSYDDIIKEMLFLFFEYSG